MVKLVVAVLAVDDVFVVANDRRMRVGVEEMEIVYCHGLSVVHFVLLLSLPILHRFLSSRQGHLRAVPALPLFVIMEQNNYESVERTIR